MPTAMQLLLNFTDIGRTERNCMQKAAIYFVGKVKKKLSIAAPRKRVIGRSGVMYYRAITKASPGTPPRKLSGRLRSSITWRWSADGKSIEVGTNVFYGQILEEGNHPFLLPTLQEERNRLAEILAGG